jgi:Uma2 family endonuclease
MGERELVAVVPEFPIWKLTIDQYHQMVAAGILTKDDTVELLEGWLITKMPKSPRHRLMTRLIRDALEKLLPDGWFVESQEPLTLSDSEPEPDVMIVRGSPRDYADHHPGPADVGLVVEVADSTLVRDHKLKTRVYARAGIPVYWLLNIAQNPVWLEVYSNPSDEFGAYQQHREYGSGDTVPVTLEDIHIGTLALNEINFNENGS